MRVKTLYKKSAAQFEGALDASHERPKLKSVADGPATVEFYLAAYPEDKLQARIASADQISQTAQTDETGNVFHIRLDVPPAELADLMIGLRSGSTGQAKIQTTDRPLGYVLLRKVIRFFRVAFF